MRALVYYLLFVGLSIYSWKDWFKSLCGLVVLTALIGRLDYPERIAGIQGLHMWNFLFANIFLSWLLNRRRQGLIWDMPRIINVFLVLWLGVILAGFVRMMLDQNQAEGHTLVRFISMYLIDPIKWPIVGLLLFEGCRTRHRVKVAIVSILLLFGLFTIQIVKYVPSMLMFEPGNLGIPKPIRQNIGMNINDAAKMMSGVPWAMLTIIPLLKKSKYRIFMFGACATSLFALFLTGGRSGYIACGATLVFLCVLHWRRYLLLLPFVVLILATALPGATARMLVGFGEVNVAGESVANQLEITAGRNIIWPIVISKILESPVSGFGRESMRRTGLKEKIRTEMGRGEGINHPHQAYLEVLLDSGLIGFVVIVGLYMSILVFSARLFVDRGDPLYTAAGGLALALLTGHLVANIGGSSFYPRVIDLGLWCAIGVMLRLYVARFHHVAKIDRHVGELFPRVNFIVTNLRGRSSNVVKFDNKRGTAEQWIKEGKYASNWTRLSCHDFVDNQVHLQLFALAYNIGNFLRRLALPERIKKWSLRTLKEKLIKIGAKVIEHLRYVIFQMAEVAVPKDLFCEILERSGD